MLVGNELGVDAILDEPNFAAGADPCASRIQAPDDLQVIRPMALIRRLGLEWKPDFGGTRRLQLQGTGRHNADDRIGRSVESDGAAENAGVRIEFTAPEVGADQANARASFFMLLREKRSAQQRLRS
jgi:hypothetical protein